MQGTAAKGYHEWYPEDLLADAEGSYSTSIPCNCRGDAGSSSKAAVDVYRKHQSEARYIPLSIIPDEEKNGPASRHAKRIGLL